MESKHRLAPNILLTIVIYLALTACAPIQTQPAPATATPTSAPTPTATVQWFPPTSTPTPFNLDYATSTPYPIPGIGETLLKDDFTSASAWNTVNANEGSVNISRNRITIAVKQPEIYLISLRDEPIIGDFYAEINAHPSLCRGGDSYGFLFRANSTSSYRYALACDGTVRLERMSFSRARSIYPPTLSGDVPPGSPGDVRLGVWVAGSEMRFFLNGRYQFSAVDVNLSEGTLGVFAQSSPVSSATTVTFSDLIVQSVGYISPTPTPTVTKTPVPTSTQSP